MKASFMILPALLMSAAQTRLAGGEASREKRVGSAQAPPHVPNRGWVAWAWTRRPSRKKTGAAE